MSKIDFGGATWAAHNQEHWLEAAANPRFPYCLRVVFVAYGRHSANGHARLTQGELAECLVKPRNGEIVLPDRRTVRRAIDEAIGYGFLHPDSKALCLVVPHHAVQGGRGDEDAPCDRHKPPRARHQLRAVS